MKAVVVNNTKITISEKSVKRILQTVINELVTVRLRQKNKLELAQITIVFLSFKEMQKINQAFRSKNKPTDVLSFAPVEPNSMGELLFCVDVLKKQARENNHSLGHEFLYMLIHGVLHLLGYDHELSHIEEKLMFGIQDKLFQRLTAQKIKLDL